MLNWNEVSFCKRGKIINFRKKILRVRTKPMCKTQPTCDVWFKSQTVKLVVEGKSSLQYATSITPTDYWQSADCWPTVGCLSVEGSCSLPLHKVLVDLVSWLHKNITTQYLKCSLPTVIFVCSFGEISNLKVKSMKCYKNVHCVQSSVVFPLKS